MTLSPTGAPPQQGSASAPPRGELSSWPTRIFFAVQIVAALVILVTQAPRFEGDPALLAVFIALNILASLVPIVIYGDSSLSVVYV